MSQTKITTLTFSGQGRGNIWHFLSGSSSGTSFYGGLALKEGSVEVWRDEDYIYLKDLKFSLTMRSVDNANPFYIYKTKLCLYLIKGDSYTTKDNSYKGANGNRYDNSNKLLASSILKEISLHETSKNYYDNITKNHWDEYHENLIKIPAPKDGVYTYVICMNCGNAYNSGEINDPDYDDCNFGYKSPVVLGSKENISFVTQLPPDPPSIPSVSNKTYVPVGDSAEFKITNKGNQYRYQISTRNANGTWSSQSWKGWTSGSSKTVTVETNKTISAVRIKVQSRNVKDSLYSEVVEKESTVVYVKLRSPKNVILCSNSELSVVNNISHPILYGNLFYAKVETDSRNPGDSSPTITYSGPGISNVPQRPLYCEVSTAQAYFTRSNFIQSDITVSATKAFVKLRPYDIALVTPATVGDYSTASADYETTTPHPSGHVPQYTWRRNSSPQVVESRRQTCQIKANDYVAYPYATWKSGSRHLENSEEVPSSKVLVRRCPRDMKNNGFTHSFKISNDGGQTYKNHNEVQDSQGRTVITVDNNIYFTCSSFNPSLTLGRFNWYEVSFYENNVEITRSKVLGDNLPDRDYSGSPRLLFNLIDLISGENPVLIPGHRYKIKFTCCYKYDSSLDKDTPGPQDKIFRDPKSSYENSKWTGASDTNVFWSSEFLLEGRPETPEILYPSIQSYPTLNDSPCILFKVYNPDYLVNIGKETIKSIKVTIGSNSLEGFLVHDEDKITQYFEDISYDKGYEVAIYDNNRGLRSLGKKMTKGSIVAFRIPKGMLSDGLITRIKITCTNEFNVESEVPAETSFTYYNPPYVIKRKEALGSAVADLCNYTIKYLNNYRNFTYVDPEDKSKGSKLCQDITDFIKKDSYTEEEVKSSFIYPDKTDTIDRLLVSCFQSLRYTYNEVQKLTLSKSKVEFKKSSSRNDIVININRSRYRYQTSSLRGTRRFIYDGSQWKLSASDTLLYNIRLSDFGITVTSSTSFKSNDWFEVETVEEHYVDPGLSGVAPRDPDDDPRLDNSYTYQNSPIIASQQTDEDYYEGNLFNQIVDILAHML